jgi:putative ABC transport system ATP-binding protein
MLSARKITIDYGNGPIFEPLDISIEQGKTLGIIGKSGSGKSSMLYILSGLRKPTTGSVTFDNQDLWNNGINRLELRRTSFGFIFQQHLLINYLTIIENILVPTLGKGSVEDAKNLLSAMQMDGLGDRFPHQLSGGQRQRAAVARALINRPRVIFADEPTASLDQENASLVLELLQEQRRKIGSALVLVTHNISTIQGFDFILNLDKEAASSV